MKHFLKINIVILLILVTVLSPLVAVSARGAETAGEYEPFRDGIVSSYYHIDYEKGYITGIAPGTPVQQLLNVCLPGNAAVSSDRLATGVTLSVTCAAPVPPETEPTEPPTEATEPPSETTAPPTEATELPTETTAPPTEVTEPVTETTAPPMEAAETTAAPAETTGGEPQSQTTAEPETKTHTLTVIVTGDLNGDGHVTITDMLMIKSAVLGETLSETAALAADLNYDGKVTITDFLKVKACLLELETVSAGWPAGKKPVDPLLLMTPQGTQAWAVPGAAFYVSGDESLAVIDRSGTITAQAKEGSTFVYALDENDQIITRAMVTVLSEQLTISLGETTQRLIMGQMLTLTPRFNHLVFLPVTWSSSDPTVVAVNENGALTTVKPGTAVITATLPHGVKAECTIQVIPPVTDIAFDRSLYKVKPGSSRTLTVTLTPADTGEEVIWSSSDTSIATVDNNGTVTGIANGTVTITAKGRYSGLYTKCKVKVCNVKQVAITFDDGPSVHTATLLDYLREAQIPATFFMVGNRLESYSNTVKQMVADGHEIGYHSYAHTLHSYLSSKQITADFNKSSEILKELTGAEFTVWRAPGGDISPSILKAIPLPHIMWSVDTRDWETQNSDSNYWYITRARDGDIILLHDLYSPSVNGAIRAMKDMIAGDYEFVTVTELLTRGGKTIENSTNYLNG